MLTLQVSAKLPRQCMQSALLSHDCLLSAYGLAKMCDYPCYIVLWKDFPTEFASWQYWYPVQRGITGGIPHAGVDE